MSGGTEWVALGMGVDLDGRYRKRVAQPIVGVEVVKAAVVFGPKPRSNRGGRGALKSSAERGGPNLFRSTLQFRFPSSLGLWDCLLLLKQRLILQ